MATSPGVLQLFPSRVVIGYVNGDRGKPVMMSPEFFRALSSTYATLTGTGGGSTTVENTMVETFASVVTEAADEMVFFQEEPQQEPLIDVFQPISDRTNSGTSTVTVGASPYTYAAARDGYVTVQGGTVSQISYIRGATTVNTGETAGMFPIQTGDSVQITYAVAPTVTFIPR